MARTSDPTLQTLHDQFDEARLADVPNLVEIRRCRRQIIDYLARCVIELMRADEAKEETKPIPFHVIRNDAPDRTTPRGLCSPVKTDEVRQFEESVRAVFGNIESCTMSWGGH